MRRRKDGEGCFISLAIALSEIRLRTFDIASTRPRTRLGLVSANRVTQKMGLSIVQCRSFGPLSPWGLSDTLGGSNRTASCQNKHKRALRMVYVDSFAEQDWPVLHSRTAPPTYPRRFFLAQIALLSLLVGLRHVDRRSLYIL